MSGCAPGVSAFAKRVIAGLFLVLWVRFAEEYVRSDPEAAPDPEAASPAPPVAGVP